MNDNSKRKMVVKESKNIRKMDIDVKGMGIPLSDYLKDGWQTLSL